MELHIWCGLSGTPSIDPYCIATAWLASEKNINIYQSCATHLSPNGQLPLLILDNGDKVYGFSEIVTAMGYKITGTDLAAISYIQQLTVITQWQLFLIKENYEDVIRPLISSKVPFPMQYNAAIQEQRRATSAQPANVRSQKQPEGLNKLHTAMLEKDELNKQLKEIPKANMRRMVQFSEICDTLLKFKLGEISSYLMAANLQLLSLPTLPELPLESLIDENKILSKLRNEARARSVLVVYCDTPYERQRTLLNVLSTYLY